MDALIVQPPQLNPLFSESLTGTYIKGVLSPGVH